MNTFTSIIAIAAFATSMGASAATPATGDTQIALATAGHAVENGIRLNGFRLNGFRLNGFSLQGYQPHSNKVERTEVEAPRNVFQGLNKKPIAR